jgi:hypothetical protein
MKTERNGLNDGLEMAVNGTRRIKPDFKMLDSINAMDGTLH